MKYETQAKFFTCSVGLFMFINPGTRDKKMDDKFIYNPDDVEITPFVQKKNNCLKNLVTASLESTNQNSIIVPKDFEPIYLGTRIF